jgi:WD40 repeat protein
MRLQRMVLMWLTQLGLMAAPLYAEQEALLLRTLPGPTSDSFLDDVCDVAFSPDGRLLASVNNKTVRLWDTTSWKNVVTLSGSSSEGLCCVRFAPDGRRLVFGEQGDFDDGTHGVVRVWTVAGQNTSVIGDETEKSGPARCVAFTPDGSRIVAGKSGDGTVRVWDFPTGKNPIVLRGHTGYVTSVTVSPDGKLIASASSDGTVKLWSMATRKSVKTLDAHAGPVYSVKFDPGGNRVASGNSDSTIKLWDVSTGKNVITFTGHTNKSGKTVADYIARTVYSVAYSPDGMTLASGGGDKTVRLWDVRTGKNTSTLKGHTDTVLSVAFAPNGETLASGSSDKTIKIWRISQAHDDATPSPSTNKER